MDEVNVEDVRAVMVAARGCAMEMIQRELPDVEMPDELRAETEQVCTGLIGTKHDVISELAELDDLLGNGNPDADVRTRVNRIVTWMGLDIMQMHELVSALHSAARENPDHGAAFVLVAESAANIVKAFGPAVEAAERIRGQA